MRKFTANKDGVYEEIETGTLGKTIGKRDCVFAIIYAKRAVPYIAYPEFVKNGTNMMNVPLVLIGTRWNGLLGFPGGCVEEHHESLLAVIKDELIEEINFT